MDIVIVLDILLLSLTNPRHTIIKKEWMYYLMHYCSWIFIYFLTFPVKERDRCKLFCKMVTNGKRVTAYFPPAMKVVDGTKCGPDTSDICVAGHCQVRTRSVAEWIGCQTLDSFDPFWYQTNNNNNSFILRYESTLSMWFWKDISVDINRVEITQVRPSGYGGRPCFFWSILIWFWVDTFCGY